MVAETNLRSGYGAPAPRSIRPTDHSQLFQILGEFLGIVLHICIVDHYHIQLPGMDGDIAQNAHLGEHVVLGFRFQTGKQSVFLHIHLEMVAFQISITNFVRLIRWG